MYVFATKYATAQKGTAASPCGSVFGDISIIGPLQGWDWSLQPTHLVLTSQTSLPLPFLCQNQRGHMYEMDGRRTLLLWAHHHSRLQQVGPMPTPAPVPLTPYLSMPIAEATMTLLQHLVAIIIASLEFFLQLPKLRLTFFSTLFGGFGVHGPD